MTEPELKALGVRIISTTRDLFTSRAEAEGLNQTEMLDRMIIHYIENPPGNASVTPSEESARAQEPSLEKIELTKSIESIKSAAKDLESMALRIKDSDGAEGYKRSLKEVAEEASAINTLLSGIKKLHEIIVASHKLILDAASNASEPFAKIVLDQTQQAQKFSDLYKAMAININALNKSAIESVENAKKIASTLDHQVTNAVTKSAINIYEKTEKFLDVRNRFLNLFMGGTIAALVVSGGSLFYSTMFVKEQADTTMNLAQSCVSFYSRFEAAACDFRKGKKAKIEELMTSAGCK